jgi:histidinol dehydrogenase
MARESAKAILPVLETKTICFDRAFAKLVRRREEVQDDVTKTVRRIIDRVREVGDDEVRALTKKFDGASLDEFEVNRAEFEEAG